MIRKDIPPSAPLPESTSDGSGDDLITAEDLFGDLVDAPLPVETHRPASARPGPLRVQVAEAGALETEAKKDVKKAAKPSDIPPEELALLLDAFAPAAPSRAQEAVPAHTKAPSEAQPDEMELLVDTMAGLGETSSPPQEPTTAKAVTRPSTGPLEAVDQLLEDLAPKPAAPRKREDLSDLLEGLAAASEPASHTAPGALAAAAAPAAVEAADITPAASAEFEAAEPTPSVNATAGTEADETIPESAAFTLDPPAASIPRAEALQEAKPTIPVEAGTRAEVVTHAEAAPDTEPLPPAESVPTAPAPVPPIEAAPAAAAVSHPPPVAPVEAPVSATDLDALMEASLARGTHPEEIDQLLDGFDALPSIEGEAPTADSSGPRFQAAAPQVAPYAETRPDLDLAAVADEAIGSSRGLPKDKTTGGSGGAFVEGSYGPYRLLERVAVGGMAEVFKAKRSGVEGFEKVVAVKRILSHLSDNKEFVEMFIGEAKIVAGLTHPNVVQIFDLGKIEKSYYIAMEYIHGRDLRSILKRAKEKGLRLPLDLSVLIVGKVCSALEYAHRKKDEGGRSMKIVHRDISPQNILISFEGEVKLADFGIAKAANSAAITDRGVLRGKLLYMSPEQAWGQSMDRRSDVFSLGVVFYEMVTDTKLFMGTSERGILETVRECHVMPPTTLNPRIPERLEAVIMKALEKDPEQRYQDASEMYRDLERVLPQRQPPTAAELARFMEILFDGDQRAEPEPDEHGSGENRPRAASLEIDLDPGGAAPAPGPSGSAATAPETNDSGINRLLKRFGIK